jgi:CubicO group peptidase (beta-lactamase class C family)
LELASRFNEGDRVTVVVVGAAVALACGLFYAVRYFIRLAPIAAGFKAKVLCSAVFVSGRTIDPRSTPDTSEDNYRPLRFCGTKIDVQRRTVTCSWWGLWRRTAIYRPGLGATLALQAPVFEPDPLQKSGCTPFPRAIPEMGSDPITEIVESAFTEPVPRKRRRTRAIVVVHDGRIVAERYAEGFGHDTALPGWSMTKSVVGALIGILVGEGRLSLDATSLIPEWRGAGDTRAAITLEDLLRMRSGLAFSEVYSDPRADVTQMLYARADTAAFAATRPLAARPGTTWQYSSGTTNVLSRIMRDALGDREYHAFPARALFDPLDMRSAVMEPDAAGTFVGSSYMLATARDWAAFGQLYLDDGMWEGRRILPTGWVAFSSTPTPQSAGGRFGAHWWLTIPSDMGGETEAASRIPVDAFFALGHEGQTLTVVPSLRLVVVRLGMSIYIDAWDQARFIADLCGALRRTQ